MKSFLALVLLALVGTAHAQWFSTTYALKGGWNAIYLHGEATHATPDVLFPNSGQTAGVIEVWRWNPRPNQIQFTYTPLIPASGTPEWNVWKRGLPAQSNLLNLTGQTAYLVKCNGTAATAWNVPILQKALPPSATWVRSGANLLGFPSKLTAPNYPSFSTYFQSFPAALAGNAKIFKYVGGDLGPANPLQIFSTTLEQVDRNKPYWFEAEVVGNFYAPLNISLSQAAGLDFGRTGSVVTALVRNTTSANMTLTLAPLASLAAPAGQDTIVGQVPLTRRTFNTGTASWTETSITGAYTEVIGANSTVELSFGINRAAMAGASNALYASLLRLTDSGNLFDISLPVSARVASMAGLWVGDATLTNVSSQVQSTATARGVITDGVLTGIEVTSGGFGYSSVPVPVIASPDGVQATATATIASGAVTGLSLTNPGSGYAIAPEITIPAPAGGTAATARATVSRGSVTGLAILSGGSGYTGLPVVTLALPAAAVVQAAATAVIAGGKVAYAEVTNPGAGYFSPPSVTIGAPEGGTAATAVATVNQGRLTGITVLTPGTGYTAAPVVTVGPPPARSAATATAIVEKGKVTGYAITNGGSGYLAAPAITIPAPVPPGTATARTPSLRTILHVDDGGTARVLSQVFIGKLSGGSDGLCTKESGLSTAELASASRIVAAHLPLDRVLAAGSGSVAPGQTLVRTCAIPFDDATNPFVHRYHPDHNNKSPRGQPLSAGVESYGITRTLSFEFTATPPPGVSATGWGSTSIGGNYTEVIKGLHIKDHTVTGTFILRRASEIGTLTVN
ncbi:MAG: hypothetical protein DVB22_002973 [Verrucomicrobia bacterium]|nr:MAG: hypothetical protein DVB22_002973 [Verrucomicrobiota bacterium]